MIDSAFLIESVQTKHRNAPGILVAQVFDLFGLAYLHASVLRLPGTDGVLTDGLFPRNIVGRAPRLNLLQRSDDLRLRVPAFAHLPSPFLRPNRIPKWTESGGRSG
jgi:hypothetical protein